MRGRLAAAMTLAAAIYGELLFVVAGTHFGGGAAYAIYAQPLAVSALVFVLLRDYCTTGSRTAASAAAAVAVAYLAWSVLGALSLAAGSFPAAVLLVAAVALTPGGVAQSPERSVSCSASRLS